MSYKIISNVLANRLKPILSTIILENQSAFVLGCLITDNVLVAFQIMHYLKKKKGKESYMAVKLDMSKAYDRVELCFLKKVMERMGFNDKWISLIMNCITTLTYFVLINGVAQGCITPTRGLRQGDPISLYLFLLCLEGFIGLILEATRNNRLSRISIYRNCPTVSHLFLPMTASYTTKLVSKKAGNYKESFTSTKKLLAKRLTQLNHLCSLAEIQRRKKEKR